MAVSKVVYGTSTLIDLIDDTVTAETLALGVTAHNAQGVVVVGTLVDPTTAYPEYTYTGESQLLDDGSGNWRLKLLTTGTLTFLKVGSPLDVFCVGGGGGGSVFHGTYGGGSGGGGGYTTTQKSVAVAAGTPYEIVIGAGGSPARQAGSNGGDTSAFGVTAKGGYGGGTGSSKYIGGAGGSGGGGVGTTPGVGGSDGGNGGDGSNGIGGAGQGRTTREFGEESGDLYAGGGGGSTANKSANTASGGEGGGGQGGGSTADPKNGKVNTGGGGGGHGGNDAGTYGGTGGSGIVIIRNHR